MFENLEKYYREKNPPAPPPPPVDDRERAYLHTVQAGAWLPVLQAAVLGAGWGLLAGLLAILLDLPKPWAWMLTAWALVQAVTLTGLLWRWLRLTQPVEMVTGLDLDQDGYVGPPPSVRLELAKDNQTVIADIPTSQAKLVRLAQGLQAGLGLAEGIWTGSNGPFSRAEYRAVRAELQARGLIAPASDKSLSQGFALTSSGKAAMRYFASLAASPTPTLIEPEE